VNISMHIIRFGAVAELSVIASVYSLVLGCLFAGQILAGDNTDAHANGSEKSDKPPQSNSSTSIDLDSSGSDLSNLTLFFTPQQRRMRIDERGDTGSFMIENQVGDKKDMTVSHVIDAGNNANSLQAPIVKRPSKPAVKSAPPIYYSAIVSSSSGVRLLINDLPCHTVRAASESCSALRSGSDEARLLNCPHLSSLALTICLDVDKQTLALLDKSKIISRLQVGDSH